MRGRRVAGRQCRRVEGTGSSASSDRARSGASGRHAGGGDAQQGARQSFGTTLVAACVVSERVRAVRPPTPSRFWGCERARERHGEAPRTRRPRSVSHWRERACGVEGLLATSRASNTCAARAPRGNRSSLAVAVRFVRPQRHGLFATSRASNASAVRAPPDPRCRSSPLRRFVRSAGSSQTSRPRTCPPRGNRSDLAATVQAAASTGCWQTSRASNTCARSRGNRSASVARSARRERTALSAGAS